MCRALTKQPRSDRSWPGICIAVQQFHHQVPHIMATIKHGFLPWRSEDMQAHIPNAAWNRYVTINILVTGSKHTTCNTCSQGRSIRGFEN